MATLAGRFISARNKLELFAMPAQEPDERANKPDERFFFEQGEAFLLPSVLLYAAEGGKIYNLGLPAFTVCEAFAAEAYLKSLIKIQTARAALQIHDLKRLFDQLNADTRGEIRAEWMDRHAWSVLNVAPGNAPDGRPFQTAVPKTFEEALELSAKAFLKWRYDFHEHHAWHMRALGYLARRQILKLRPDWRPIKGTYFAAIDPDAQFAREAC